MEMLDIEIDIDGLVMPEKNNKIALIDADTIAYIACLNTEVAVDLFGSDMYSEMEWDAITTSPQYIPEEDVIYQTNIQVALSKAEEKLQRILDKTGCTSVELHFTGGRENFRYTVKSDYKANRTGRPPAGLSELKQELLVKYPGTLSTKWEADDTVVYKKKLAPEDYILCAIDKDVINSLAGRHFNYYESSLYNKEMHWVEIDELTALRWPYLQTLTGDTTDNIDGLSGIGPTKGLKILSNASTHTELWDAVVKAYARKGKSAIDAMITMNLVNMHLLTGDIPEIKLWNPHDV